MRKHLKVFMCTGFYGWNPIGTAAVVVAIDSTAAKAQLFAELSDRHLPQNEEKYGPITITELNSTQSGVFILNDGDY